MKYGMLMHLIPPPDCGGGDDDDEDNIHLKTFFPGQPG